jgi:hypothetical protein
MRSDHEGSGDLKTGLRIQVERTLSGPPGASLTTLAPQIRKTLWAAHSPILIKAMSRGSIAPGDAS